MKNIKERLSSNDDFEEEEGFFGLVGAVARLRERKEAINAPLFVKLQKARREIAEGRERINGFNDANRYWLQNKNQSSCIDINLVPNPNFKADF